MCEKLDWLSELHNLVWAVRSLEDLHERGSCEREIINNATRGIKSRIEWCIAEAKAEVKREPYH